jgi:acetylornithine deacetylase
MVARPNVRLDQERAVTLAVAERRDDLVALASALIRFDTTAGDPAEPGRDEAALQALIEARLRAAGAETDLWEPDPGELDGSRRQLPRGITFAGRPQLLARFRGVAEGPSLMLNGHVDVVSAEPRSRWTHPPFDPVERDGALYGRGACDMKGGVACIVLACEVLAELGIRPAGDLVVSLVTDEETSGAGAIASALRGAQATAAIVPEPTGFQVWTSSRGSLLPRITVPGRSGHAEVEQPAWQDGGAVNAIEKARIVAVALERLRARWREGLRHPRLGRPDLVPTRIEAGEWEVTHPASCVMAYDVPYLPAQADAEGWGTRVEAEIEDAVRAAALEDGWLAAHPPVVDWGIDVPPGDLPAGEPVVRLALGLADVVGRGVDVATRSAWYDGVTFTRLGTPSIAFGPGAIDQAHAVDEHVPVDDLVACAQALAVASLRVTGERR